MLRIFHIFLVCLFLSVPAGAAYASDTQNGPEDLKLLITKMADAAGGEKVIQETAAVKMSGDLDAFMRQDRGSYELVFKRPRKLRVETKYQRSSETRILNNDKGYRGIDGARPEPAKGQRYLAMVYQYKHLDLLYGLLRGMFSVSIKGKEELNGKPAEVLHLEDKEGPLMDVYVDTQTFHVVKVTGYFKVMEGRTTTLSSEFSDYRKVGDIVLPFRIISLAGGDKLAETLIKTYVINPEIPDSAFEP